MSRAVFAQGWGAIALPPPQTTGTVSLLQALRARRSTREFSSRPLPLDVLSTLLWSAFGVDRRKVAPKLQLRTDQRIVLAQTVGYPG